MVTTCQICYASQIYETVHLQVIQSARSSNNNVHAFGNRIDLSFPISTTIYANARKNVYSTFRAELTCSMYF